MLRQLWQRELHRLAEGKPLKQWQRLHEKIELQSAESLRAVGAGS